MKYSILKYCIINIYLMRNIFRIISIRKIFINNLKNDIECHYIETTTNTLPGLYNIPRQPYGIINFCYLYIDIHAVLRNIKNTRYINLCNNVYYYICYYF